MLTIRSPQCPFVLLTHYIHTTVGGRQPFFCVYNWRAIACAWRRTAALIIAVWSCHWWWWMSPDYIMNPASLWRIEKDMIFMMRGALLSWFIWSHGQRKIRSSKKKGRKYLRDQCNIIFIGIHSCTTLSQNCTANFLYKKLDFSLPLDFDWMQNM